MKIGNKISRAYYKKKNHLGACLYRRRANGYGTVCQDRRFDARLRVQQRLREEEEALTVPYDSASRRCNAIDPSLIDCR